MRGAVVVTYSALAPDLTACVEALVAAGGLDLIVVIDNGGAATIGPDVGTERTAVELHRTPNDGYGAAANAGFAIARAAGCHQIALLNDDVIVGHGWVEPLVAALTGRVGAVQPKLLVAGTNVINSLGVAIGRDGAGTDIGDGELDTLAVGATPAAPHLIEIFTGGAVLFSDEFLVACGGFDERYFLYYEDVDLALRGARLGWEYLLAPASIVEHARGSTTSSRADQTRLLQERNRLWAAFRFAGPATCCRAVWLSIRRLRHPPYAVHRRALLAGLAGAPRRLRERLQARRT